MSKRFIIIVFVGVLIMNLYCHATDERIVNRSERIIYSYGSEDESWIDMGEPISGDGVVDTAMFGNAFPSAIYCKLADNFVHTINLHFSIDKDNDMVFLMNILYESGDKRNISNEELKVYLSGKLVQAIDILPESPKPEKERRIILSFPATKGKNILTIDMSHNIFWCSCWFDSVLLYKKYVSPSSKF